MVDDTDVVAVVNGETITRKKLSQIEEDFSLFHTLEVWRRAAITLQGKTGGDFKRDFRKEVRRIAKDFNIIDYYRYLKSRH